MAKEVPWLQQKIVIIGDIILDEYVEGYVDRISPEAPVPVLDQTSVNYRLGGAANVALNIKRLGGEPVMIGSLGMDRDGHQVEFIFRENGIDDRNCFYASKPTTKKTRFVTEDGFQLLRCDYESTAPISPEEEKKILDNLQTRDFDCLVVVDYNKGLLTDSLIRSVLNLTKEKKIPSIVDPIKKDYTVYKGCELIKPNKKEAAAALKLESREFSGSHLATSLKDTFGFPNVLVTLGGGGMTLLTTDVTPEGFKLDHIQSATHEVYDVSGAGDTVTAMMALGMSSGLNKKKSAEWASLAAGVAVEHHGTYAPSLAEVIGSSNGD